MVRVVVGVAIVIALLFADWTFVGNLRVHGLARDYFMAHHGTATVVNVTIQASPAIPPFWSVKIGGDVIEQGRSSPSYYSVMWLWVEPASGLVVFNGAG